jgi:hypothetical protein
MYEIRDLILRTIEEVLAGRHSKVYMKATSWDAKTHMVKGLLQPGGQESGWISAHTVSAGNGYGLMSGIVTGDGKTTGEQLEITHQEGEYEAGAVTARVHSDTNAQPPSLESGEQLLMTPFKSFIKLDKNSAITLDDANGATCVFDGKGGIKFTCKTFEIACSGSVKINGKPVDING